MITTPLYPVKLTEILTKDKVSLAGIVVQPRRRHSRALVWLHGLTSSAMSGQSLSQELSRACVKQGIGYVKFNTRGHDIVARGPRGFIGTGFERFEDCVFDVRVMFAFVRRLGYRSVLLGGHSTGASKALYYMYRTKDRFVSQLILAGPVSDVADLTRAMGKHEHVRRVRIAEGRYRQDRRALVPLKYGVFTARRYISLYQPGMPEDVFPYHNPRARWKELRSVRVPLAVIIGEKDRHLDRPAQELIAIFRKHATATPSFSGFIVPGADHGFHGKESVLARLIGQWVGRNQ